MILILRGTALVSFLIGISVMARPALAFYRLGPGDTLNVSVFGAADYKRRAVVDVDGMISLPFLGEVPAGGLGIEDLRRTLSLRLKATKTMSDPDVTVEIAEYRPFFVSGDVAKPGAVAYRPGATVRLAVALAGGYDSLRFRSDNPLLSAPGYRSEYESLWTELVRQQARELTLRAERAGSKNVDLSALFSAPIPKSVVERIADLERGDLALRFAAAERERAYLKASLKRTDDDISLERTMMTALSQAVAQQVATGQQLREAQARGIVSGYRTADNTRDISQLRADQDQSLSKLAELQRLRDELAKQAASLDDDRLTKVGRELQDVIVGIEKTRSEIRSASERLLYTNALKAQLRSGPGPDIVIHRRAEDKTIAVAASEDTPILPDDVIEVVIRPDQLVVAPTQ